MAPRRTRKAKILLNIENFYLINQPGSFSTSHINLTNNNPKFKLDRIFSSWEIKTVDARDSNA